MAAVLKKIVKKVMSALNLVKSILVTVYLLILHVL